MTVITSSSVLDRDELIPRIERTLLSALRDGDERAFLDLVQRHHAAMVRVAQGYVRSRTRFPFSGVGQRIWVDVGDTQSNRYLWPERAP